MHDPMTVAHEIKYPWYKYKPWPKECTKWEDIPAQSQHKHSSWWKGGYRETFITIWHVDPERDGSDDSCDWFGQKRRLHPQEKAIQEAMWDLETILDNRPFYPDHPAHKRFQLLKHAVWALNRRRGFRIHPRWHVWHWEIRVHPYRQLKRWLFTRCAHCQKRFTWNYSPVTYQWCGTGPLWFMSEKGLYHEECERIVPQENRKDPA